MKYICKRAESKMLLLSLSFTSSEKKFENSRFALRRNFRHDCILNTYCLVSITLGVLRCLTRGASSMLLNAVTPGIAESVMLRKASASWHNEGPRVLPCLMAVIISRKRSLPHPLVTERHLRILSLRLCSSLCSLYTHNTGSYLYFNLKTC